jgi:shikimate dehydrogenase
VDLSEEDIVARLETLVVQKNAGSRRGDSFLIGLLGRGIQASRTPAMHEREGARLALNYTYLLLDFDTLLLSDEALGAVLATAARLGFAGLNVTHPFKQSVMAHLELLEREAEAIGAVNTVVFQNGASCGHNTDSWGFATSFRESMAGCGLERVVQFGAGGAGAAVAYALLDLGVADLAIVDSVPGKAGDLAGRLASRFGRHVRAATADPAMLGTASGIVNTTPVGMAKYPGVPFAAEHLTPRQWVSEIIYFPEETELLRRARALGCRVLPGTGMAIYQAVRAFELFTGIAADPAAMIGHFRAADKQATTMGGLQ